VGDLIGGIIGGVGQAAAASEQADAAKAATEAAQQGFKYLTTGAGAKPMTNYINAGQTALTGQGTTQNAMAQLLGMAPRAPLWSTPGTPATPGTPGTPGGAPGAGAPGSLPQGAGSGGGGGGFNLPTDGRQIVHNERMPGGGSSGGNYESFVNGPSQAAAPGGQAGAPGAGGAGTPGTPGTPAIPGQTAGDAFDQYKGSTGYQFQLGQGMNALNSNAAAKGLLDSGGTAKALTQYGQNLASTTFNNYLTQLSGLNSAQGGTAQMGQNALGQIGTVGTASGSGAANAIIAGGNATAGGISGIANTIGNSLGSAFNTIGGFGGGGSAYTGNNSYPAGGGLW
jgi:hypothetical protein